MKTPEFNKYLEEIQRETVETLKAKAEEYAVGGDRLHNFRVAAGLEGVSMYAALGGMMAKHTVSVYDLIYQADAGLDVPMALWLEKIKDHINYLYLLWALVNEEKEREAALAKEAAE